MAESNSTDIESVSFGSTVQFFSPPSPQPDRVRELHHNVRPRRMLFSSCGEGCTAQELNDAELDHIQNDLFNEEIWAPVEGQFSAEGSGLNWASVEHQVSQESNSSYWAPVEDRVPPESKDTYSLHKQAENRYSSVLSCVPYNLEGIRNNAENENRDTLEPYATTYNLEDALQNFLGHSNEEDLVHLWETGSRDTQFEGMDNGSWSDNEDFDGLEGIRNNSENGNHDSLEPSVTPYNLEDALQIFLGHSNEEDLIRLWETGSKDTQSEGMNYGSWSDDDDFDGRFFETSACKPPTISDQQWRVLEAISQGKSVCDRISGYGRETCAIVENF